MEDQMDLPGFRKMELINDRSFSFRCEFRVDDEAFQVSGF